MRKRIETIEIAEGIELTCICTGTRNGFCHTAKIWSDKAGDEVTSKVSYCNRTWESYDYQSVILRLADKLDERVRDHELADSIKAYDKKRLNKGKEEMEEFEKRLEAFRPVVDKLSEGTKSALSDALTEGRVDADTAMALGTMAAIMCGK